MTTFAINDCSFGTVQHICKNINKNTVLSQKNQSFFAKVLYCPKKTKKNNSFQSSKSYRLQAFHKICFFWNSTALLQKKIGFFGTVQHFCKKINKNTVLSQKNQSFFAKVLYCPKKTKKNQSFQVLGPRRATKMEKIGFFGFFGTVQHFCKKRLVFLGQYSTFARKLTKTLYCPKKTNLFCKSAVLS